MERKDNFFAGEAAETVFGPMDSSEKTRATDRDHLS